MHYQIVGVEPTYDELWTVDPSEEIIDNTKVIVGEVTIIEDDWGYFVSAHSSRDFLYDPSTEEEDEEEKPCLSIKQNIISKYLFHSSFISILVIIFIVLISIYAVDNKRATFFSLLKLPLLCIT